MQSIPTPNCEYQKVCIVVGTLQNKTKQNNGVFHTKFGCDLDLFSLHIV
jgi:hypothetical protein